MHADQTFRGEQVYDLLTSPRTTISGRDLLRRLGSGLIGLQGTKEVIISDDVSESISESGSLSLSEMSVVSDEEEIDISESLSQCASLWERSSNIPRPRFCNRLGQNKTDNMELAISMY